ncbi:5'-3' exonuclease PLD3 [Bufo bufo]|uniref:5'-3' exonuclease PLD3 n=1 Tax=Bufo bufo TaxID=8384 RepID=UPI001ABE13CE|nr:5'-3' exonuclease PLD3 [Bufo bufo]XP_040262194.1 5'-3' exonuclease PLD3 [Bufo bufo]XP_040262195.1 5'-3' exonuclease PLD3 [Bufo bufo]
MKPKVVYKPISSPVEAEDHLIYMGRLQNNARRYYQCALVIATAVTVLFCLMAAQLLLFPLLCTSSTEKMENLVKQDNSCNDSCSIVLVESMPEGLEYAPNSTFNPSVFDSWMNLLSQAKSSVDIASFYWTLTNNDTHTQHPTANEGELILQEMLKLKQRGISLRVAVNPSGSPAKDADVNALRGSGAEVRVVNLPSLTNGVLHTKFWVVDGKHLYIGSANMDWRSLTQVKELGTTIYNCTCLAEDLGKIFEAYWVLGEANATIPSPWPDKFSTVYNKETPMEVSLNNTASLVYLSSSPPPLSAKGRTDDIDSILSIIDDAKKFVYISVMDYTPTEEFSKPRRYWPAIDNHLRKAVYERHVTVRLLISCWANSNPNMFAFLNSLAALRSKKPHYEIEVKIFIVPVSPEQKHIPFARVNHNKYMVTDRVAYIGTSNWAGDYFIRTAGSAIVVNQTIAANATNTMQEQLKDVFLRDWNSNYTQVLHSLTSYKEKCIF